MIEFAGFTEEMYAFLSDLQANNNRDWFQANKQRYIRFVREPTQVFVAAMKDRLQDVSPSYLADTRPNGGSMFRIYRDTRFSRDKSPYKVNVGCQFRHSAGRDAHAPGFYLHIQPGDNLAGGGIWLPPPAILQRIRTAIDRQQEEWMAIREFFSTSSHMKLFDAERYKRPPQGFDADHPLLEDLTLKTYFAGRSFADSEVTARDFIDAVVDTFQNLAPFMRFISDALDLSF